MPGSNFPFISDSVLRQNLDDAFQHILVLLPFSESVTYDDTAKSSFRKTIIIYTASIVEALLYHIVDTKLSEKDLETSCWELTNKNVLHKVNDSHKIIAGDLKLKVEQTKKDKLNLGQINTLLKDKKIVSKALFDQIDKVRELRNSQHIGPHRAVRAFTKTDIEGAFAVASDVKAFVKAKVR